MVAIIMGSDSDLGVMSSAAETLDEFDVRHSVDIVSAHRTPERMVEFARRAASHGYRVIIAGAGGAAHLPGMVAAMTSLPVIGVPVRTHFQDGLDSLLSIVQMPRGIPVATVAVNNARNAALLAIRILAITDTELRGRHEGFLQHQSDHVMGAASRLTDIGWKRYLEERNA